MSDKCRLSKLLLIQDRGSENRLQKQEK